MPYKLRRLVIKPTLACTAHCPSCALRLDLYEQCRHEKPLDLDQWREIIKDAHRLGCTDLHISGGEPTLYPELIELVETGTRLGMATNVNTNGSCIPIDLARGLAQAGLGSVTVSLYDWRAQVHDQARQEPGLFGRAIGAIERLQAQPGLLVDLQTILANYNVLDFDHFLKMAYQLGVGYIYVSYIEGDVKKLWLPNLDQIQQFRAAVLPRAKALIQRYAPLELREQGLRQVDNIFSGDVQRAQRFASGVYHPIEKPGCSRPYSFALVLADGQVHPCNGVEYCHEPVMGNTHEGRLVDLWTGPTWEQFRVERMEWCHRCPMNLHFRIPICGEKQ